MIVTKPSTILHIYSNARYLLNRHKRIISQCSNCQKYGHTKNYCTKDPVCVKCAGAHKTLNCQMIPGKDTVKCALCQGNHTANYKGCEIYKVLKIERFPSLRKKVLTKTNAEEPITENQSNISSGITYAQAIAAKTNNLNSLTEKDNPTEKVITVNNSSKATPTVETKLISPETNNNGNITTDMAELKEMMKSLIQQLASMMNIITLLVTKPYGQHEQHRQ